MTDRVIRGIVATDPKLAIGREGELPWHYPADLQFFKETTMGHPIVMGRKTFESIGRPLPGRRNIILSRAGRTYPGTETIASLEELMELQGWESGPLYIIGGAEVYEAAASMIEEWIVTRIPEVAEGADTFLPPTLFEGFRVRERRELGAGLVVEYLDRKRGGCKSAHSTHG